MSNAVYKHSEIINTKRWCDYGKAICTDGTKPWKGAELRRSEQCGRSACERGWESRRPTARSCAARQSVVYSIRKRRHVTNYTAWGKVVNVDSPCVRVARTRAIWWRRNEWTRREQCEAGCACARPPANSWCARLGNVANQEIYNFEKVVNVVLTCSICFLR